MKIGIIADSIDTQYAGIHFYTKHLLEALAKLNTEHEFYIVKHSSVDEGIPFYQKIIPPTLKQIRLDPLRTFVKIPRYYNSIGVDAVIEPAHFGPFHLKNDIKRITVIHDLTPILLPDFHPWYSSFLQKLTLKKILANADLIVANSDNTKKDISAIFPSVSEKIKRIYLGRDERIAFTNETVPLSKYGITQPYILFVGTLEPRKNLIELLEAYKYIREKGTEIKLVLVGKDGWHNNNFKNSLQVHPYKKDIICTGYTPREDLPVLYSNAEVFVYPSLYEGFGFPVVEALACKCPVIISNNSSLPEVGGNAALSYDLGKPAMLAEKLLEILNSSEKQQELRNNALSQAEKFSWEQYAKELLNSIPK